MPAEIRIEGLRELIRDLRSADRSLPAKVREAHKAAADLAHPAIVSRAPRGETGRLASSFVPRATQRAGRVESRHPAAGVLNFGGTIRHAGHRHSRPHVIPIKAREYGGRGLEAVRGRAADIFARLLDEIAREAGFR